MLEELIHFIKGFPDNFGFEIDEDVSVNGLKFSYIEEYPWKNKKESGKYYDDLMDDESIESYRKFIHWETIRSHERLHILISWALSLRFSSVIMFTLTFIIALLSIIPAIFTLGLALLMLFVDFICTRKAKKCRFSLFLTISTLNMLISEKTEEENEE